MMAEIVVDGVSLIYQSGELRTAALEQTALHVSNGEFLSILGPSGCGKTTLLNLLAGLLRPSSGSVRIGGARVTGPGPARAVVFQDAALLPWRTVLANVELGLEMQRKVSPAELRERARHFVRLVGLGGFATHYPHQLSGGMRQRVNLARALIADPDVLLMDEPFASLDAHTRETMGFELLHMWQETRKTVVFVTHSVDEAITLADRIAVMSSAPGRIIQELNVELPRPRAIEMRTWAQFTGLGLHIRSLLAPPAHADTSASEEPCDRRSRRALP